MGKNLKKGKKEGTWVKKRGVGGFKRIPPNML